MKKAIIITIIIILFVGLTFLLKEEKEPKAEPEDVGLGSFLYQGMNPEEESMEIPETNPFKEETNPIKKVKTNPFE